MSLHIVSSGRIPHVVEATPEGIAFAVATLSDNVRRYMSDSAIRAAVAIGDFGQVSSFVPATAMLAIPGIELDGAVKEAVQAFKSSGQSGHLLVAGYHGPKRVEEMFDERVVRQHYGLSLGASVHSQGLADHSGHQAQWVAAKCLELDVKEVQVHVPAFHLTRIYLTVLEALRRVMNPDGDFPQVLLLPKPYVQDVTAATLIDVNAEKAGGESDDPAEYRTLCEARAALGEHARILIYQKPKGDGSPGDCLTTERLLGYMQWAREALRD